MSWPSIVSSPNDSAFGLVGYSMGAQQAYQWAVSYPDLTERIAPFCGTARTTPHNAVFLLSAGGSIERLHGHLKRAIGDALAVCSSANNLHLWDLPSTAVAFPAVNNI
jgi:pimeloyl-ACP methyl ester carboxylesterase